MNHAIIILSLSFAVWGFYKWIKIENSESGDEQ